MHTTIAINAINSTSGGGKSIRDSMLRLLNTKNLETHIAVLSPPDAGLDFITNPQISIVEVPAWYSRTYAAPVVYHVMIGRVLQRIGAQVVVNLGDLIIHTNSRQVYIFDWPYALEVLPKIWQEMKPYDKLIRKTKLCLLEKDFHRPEIVIAQTNVIKDILQEKYNLRDVRVIGNAVTIPNPQEEINYPNFNLPSGLRLLYPALYYPHKNHKILLSVAERIKEKGLDYRIIVTVSPDSRAAVDFITQISARGLQEVLHNVGQVKLDDMPALYQQCDALLMPTLLESFSIVYPEAMHYGLPIITSDMWFARAVCDKAACYFDPFDSHNILNMIEEVMSNKNMRQALINEGKAQLASFSGWDDNLKSIMAIVDELLALQA